MFDTVCKMPVKQDQMPNTQLKQNIQRNEVNLLNNKHLDNNNLFATNNLEINTQDINNNNFNNNYQQVSNKRRINEDFNSNDCNDQLNKKFKHEETDTEEQTSKVYILVASIKVYLFCHLAIFYFIKKFCSLKYVLNKYITYIKNLKLFSQKV